MKSVIFLDPVREVIHSKVKMGHTRNLSKPKTESSVNVHLMFEVFGVFTNTHDYFEQKMLG
jgi:hypothetical protein